MEFADECCRVDVDDLFREDGSVVVHSDDLHSVGEWLDVQLLEESSFGSLDLFAQSTDFEILGDFDGALVDLGGDVESVEEVDLGRVQTCGSGRYSVFDGRDDSDTSFGGELVSFDFGLEFKDGSVCEDHGNFIFEDRDESFEAFNTASILFFEVLELFLSDTFGPHFNDLLGKGVLVDDEVGVVGSEKLADLLHLVGADVGEVGQDNLLVVPEQFVQFFDDGSLLCSIITHSKILN